MQGRFGKCAVCAVEAFPDIKMYADACFMADSCLFQKMCFAIAHCFFKDVTVRLRHLDGGQHAVSISPKKSEHFGQL